MHDDPAAAAFACINTVVTGCVTYCSVFVLTTKSLLLQRIVVSALYRDSNNEQLALSHSRQSSVRATLLWPMRLPSWLPCPETLQLRLWQLVANKADYSTAVTRAVSPG